MTTWCALSMTPGYISTDYGLSEEEKEKFDWSSDCVFVDKKGKVTPTRYGGYSTVSVDGKSSRLLDPSCHFEDEHDGLLVINDVYQLLLSSDNYHLIEKKNLYNLLKKFSWRSRHFHLAKFFEVGCVDLVVAKEEDRQWLTNCITEEHEYFWCLSDPKTCERNKKRMEMIVEDFIRSSQ